ncbi:MAG: hypothetical protein ACI8SA_001665 [Dokdonia sp.]|jgi:uncharacterized protein with HEPN domain
MSKRDNTLLLEDMHEAALKIKSYTSGYSLSDFLNDDKTIDAVVRNLEIIGEASNRIETEFKYQNPEVPWNQLRGLRNRLVHEYFGIDLDIVWTVVDENMDELINWIEIALDK